MGVVQRNGILRQRHQPDRKLHRVAGEPAWQSLSVPSLVDLTEIFADVRRQSDALSDPLRNLAMSGQDGDIDLRSLGKATLHRLYMDDRVKDYIVSIVFATRDPRAFGLAELAPLIEYGASPRATIFLTLAARAHAFLRRRAFVTPEDVKAVAYDVLRHRLTLTYEAEAEEVTPEKVVSRVLDRVEVP